MKRVRDCLFMLTVALLWAAPAARASRGLDVDVWTDRGADAVYRPGETLEMRVRASEDAYLLVYEINAEGRVSLLFPERGSRGFVPAGETLRIPSEHSNLELVVEGPAGQGFLVAITSREPFRALPWYLRPYDPHAEDLGYAGANDDEEGLTTEGRIVGDPFVAMERIRRRVLVDPASEGAFATAYSSYYVHHEVRYPRYLCYDCHRPHQWAWWDGFDPYYANCSVFGFRINSGWYWGPGYWYGAVPYYYYVYRPDCPPRYQTFVTHDVRYSSWDGWRRWRSMWGANLRREKSAPPPTYVPPTRFDYSAGRGLPPGFRPGREVGRGRDGGLKPVVREDAGRESGWRREARPGSEKEGDQGGFRDPGRGRVPQGQEATPRRRPEAGSQEGGRERPKETVRPQTPERRPDSGYERPRSQPQRPPEVSRERGRSRSEPPQEKAPPAGKEREKASSPSSSDEQREHGKGRRP